MVEGWEIKLKIQTTEFSQDIIDKIRQFIFLNGESELVINISLKKKKKFPTETAETYFKRIDRSINALKIRQILLISQLLNFILLLDLNCKVLEIPVLPRFPPHFFQIRVI